MNQPKFIRSTKLLTIFMTDEDLKKYQKFRIDNGFPEVSDSEAMKESTAIDNLLALLINRYFKQFK